MNIDGQNLQNSLSLNPYPYQETKQSARSWVNSRWDGGDERSRTADPLLAKQVLSQLSYIPLMSFPPNGGPSWDRTRDLTLIKRAL